MENEFRMRGLAPTYVHQIEGDDTVQRDVFQLLCETNRLVRIKAYVAKSDIVVHTENFDNAVAMIEANFTFPQKFTVSEVRELIGSNRKFTVPFLEHLDAVGVTTRMGNQRQLRNRNEQ